MVTSAKFQPGDLVILITDPGHTPGMVVGVTEWMDGGATYSVAIGAEREEFFGGELTAALLNGLPLSADDFGPGEYLQKGDNPGE